MNGKPAGIVDFDYLEGVVGRDIGIVLEVLALFRQQAEEAWLPALEAPHEGWRATAHTIKGAARGIGANALGDACDKAEFGAPEDLPAVKSELAAAMAAIAAYQAEKR